MRRSLASDFGLVVLAVLLMTLVLAAVFLLRGFAPSATQDAIPFGAATTPSAIASVPYLA